MTARQWLTDAAARLQAISGDARFEARMLLSDALGVSPGALVARADGELNGAILEVLEGQLARRLSGAPLQYAQKRAWFWKRAFYVDERVLIPQPDTEILFEAASAHITPPKPRALDLCTGSGVLAATMALEKPFARVTATDISQDALCVARKNAQTYGARIEFLEGDFLEPVLGRRFDVIVCNPPYVAAYEMDALPPDVRREPKIALLGGSDGLDFYRRAQNIRDYLTPGGAAFFEVGAGQADAVKTLLGGETAVYQDFSGIDRVVAAFRRET